MIAGILAVVSAAALMLIIWSMDGGLREPDATVHQRTVDVIVQTRIAATVQTRATLTAEATLELMTTEDAAQ